MIYRGMRIDGYIANSSHPQLMKALVWIAPSVMAPVALAVAMAFSDEFLGFAAAGVAYLGAVLYLGVLHARMRCRERGVEAGKSGMVVAFHVLGFLFGQVGMVLLVLGLLGWVWMKLSGFSPPYC
ncbi:hypothetical protein [Luteolibacter sp. Populi]|uniref:hypothetical protein n=1 Tax=Luteolibacter sp. Populi TaxID=3230487 RepID=UPI0034678BA8